jgi:hypothetical protein
MKFDHTKTFPYPVLRPHSDDYMESEFQAIAEFEIQGNDIKVNLSYHVSSSELLKMLDDGLAKYVSVISCRDTYYRNVIITEKSQHSESIDGSSLRGKVITDSYVVAIDNIKNYSFSDINPEFGKTFFDFRPGEIMAQEETQVLFIERDLFTPVSSVFQLVKNQSLNGGEWRVSLDQDNVQIEVSSEMKENIDNKRSNSSCRAILLNSIYFSAACHAIQQLKDDDGYNDYKWARVITQQMHNSHIDLNTLDAYIITQKLMKNPLSILNSYIFSKKDYV